MTRVLLTGGSGFIAAHVLDILLAHGHSVVTTVRSQEKADRIASAHPNTNPSQLSFAIVKDVAEPNAFDAAVQSSPPFEAVIHTASPFHFNVTDVQTELLDPAIQGTTGILKSIAAYAPSVKSVVVTSSFASIVNANQGAWPEHTYSEADWNPITHAEALENPGNGYRASKTFAERAAWDFVEKEKPAFQLTTLCPPLVLGPIVHYLNSLEALNTSNQRIRNVVQGEYREPGSVPDTGTYLWVDVRDIALAHVLAIEKPEAAGERFFVVTGHFSNEEIVEVVRKNFPQYADRLPPKGNTGGAFPDGGMFKADNSKVVKTLGLKWTPFEESITDLVKSLQAAGI